MMPAQQITGTNSRGGYVQLTIPAGYSPVTRRPVNISFHGGAFSEAKILGIGYAYEQATKTFTPVVNGVAMSLARKPASQINPSLYRCALGTSPYPCLPGPELGHDRPGARLPARDGDRERPRGEDPRQDAELGRPDQGVPGADRQRQPGRRGAQRGARDQPRCAQRGQGRRSGRGLRHVARAAARAAGAGQRHARRARDADHRRLGGAEQVACRRPTRRSSRL